MMPETIQKTNERDEKVKVIQVDEHSFHVESAEACHRVLFTPDGKLCNCEDFLKQTRDNPHYHCRHILAVENCLIRGEVSPGGCLERKTLRLNEKFIKNIQGRDFVLYAGLLDLAHQKGLSKVEVLPLQYPSPENGNVAICRAVVETKLGSFSDVGDASPDNCSYRVRKHVLRMASTRAKARAFRDFLNIGITCLEELGDLDEVIGEEPSRIQERPAPNSFRRHWEIEVQGETSPKGIEGATTSGEFQELPVRESEERARKGARPKYRQSNFGDASSRMSEAQKRAIRNLIKSRSIPEEDLEKISQETYSQSFEHLSMSDASDLILLLQQIH
jgi:hypothetical protein